MADQKLSAEELSLMSDPQLLLTKKLILEKVQGILGRVEQKLHPLLQQIPLPQQILVKSGKISQGENYQDLPYQVLDFPRHFDAHGIFAYRTMFWWGHYFSGTLHLGGHHLDPLRDTLLEKIEELPLRGDFFCVNKGPWHYHFQPSNYRPFQELSLEYLQENLSQKPFIKISQKWPFEAHPDLPDLVTQHFLDLMHLLGLDD